jgi:hypothetical protein
MKHVGRVAVLAWAIACTDRDANGPPDASIAKQSSGAAAEPKDVCTPSQLWAWRRDPFTGQLGAKRYFMTCQETGHPMGQSPGGCDDAESNLLDPKGVCWTFPQTCYPIQLLEEGWREIPSCPLAEAGRGDASAGAADAGDAGQ